MIKHVLIDRVAEALYNKRKKVIQKKNYYPIFVIYMNQDFYHECLSDISGGVSQIALQFFQDNMIQDTKVYRVVEEDHPSYRIIEL